MEFTYRIAGPADRESYIDFINYVFSHALKPSDFKEMLPKEYGDNRTGSAVHFLALDAQEHIRAVVALLPFTFKIGDSDLSCAFIGSVSVHPYARGEGHMKKLMSMADSWMKKKQIDLAILGGARQRYQYFGYTKGGLHLLYTVDSDNIRHALKEISTDGFTIEEITDASDCRLSEILALQQMSPVHTERNSDDLLDILRSYSRRVYAVMENNRFSGYFTATGDSVAELSVKNPAHYKAVLRLWVELSCQRQLTVMVPPWDHSLMRTLDSFAEYTNMGTGENYKVYRWETVLPALLTLKKLVSGHLSDGICSLCIDGQTLEICSEAGQISIGAPSSHILPETYSSLELQEKIFSPSALLHPVYIGGAPADWFPIPLSVPIADQF